MTSRLSALAFGALLLGASSWPAHAALVGFWGFDESTGTVAHDSSGSGNDALLMNGATFCTTCGITGGALDLTHGGFAEVGTAYNYSGYTPFSIQAWVRFANPGDPTYSFAVARHHSTEVAGYTIELNRTVGYANVYQTYPTTPPAPAVINDGSWHQLVAVFGSSATSIYVDGNHVGTTARVPFPSPSFANFLIGGINDASYNPVNGFDGYIENVGVWSNALTDADVAALYRNDGQVSAVPEPATWAMLVLGFCGLGLLARRRSGHPAIKAA